MRQTNWNTFKFSTRRPKAIMFYIFTSISLFVSSCSEKEEACEWYQEKFEAQIGPIQYKNISDNGDSLFTVQLIFNTGSVSNENQELGDIKNINIDRAFIERNQLKEGLKLTGLIQDVKTGTCESPIIAFEQKLR